jgi:hypothetical protein
MLDAAAGLVPPSPEFEAHLRTCVTCYEQFHELRGTMELLDEWSGPEPSSGFDALLRVRLLEPIPLTGPAGGRLYPGQSGP